MNFKKLFIFIIFFYTIVYSNTISLTQKEKNFIKNHPTIILGTDKDWEPYSIKNSDGTISGYDVSVLNLINNLTGANFILKRDHWNKMTEEVKKKKIDGLSTGVINDYQSTYLIFSKPYISLKKIIFTNIDSNYSFKTKYDLDGKTIAVNNNNPESIRIISKIKGVKLLKLNSTKDVIDAVTTQKADAMLGNASMHYILNKQGNPFLKPSIILDEKPLELVFSFRKDLAPAVTIVNKALENIGQQKLLELKKYWFQGIVTKENNKIILNNEEQNYLKTKKEIKMCNNQNVEPLEFAYNGDQNDMRGIAIDTLNIIEKKLNIKFVNVPTKNWKESQQFLKEKKCDILPAAVKNSRRLKYANFTKPYLHFPLAILTHKDSGFVPSLESIVDKKLARRSGSGMIVKLKEKYPNINIIETSSSRESLELVSNGDAYYTIDMIPIVSNIMQKYIIKDIHIAGYTNMAYDLGIAVRDDDVLLLNILNKSLDTITKKQHDDIYRKWVTPVIKEKVVEYTLIWEILGVLIFVILLFLYRQYILKKANNQLEHLVHQKTKEISDINKGLEQKIFKEIEKSKKIEQKLFQSEKLASMGEMIGNIAHQWRQPLSVISTASSGIQLQKEYDILTDEKLHESCEAINKNVQFLSNTIDDFRNFIKGDREKSIFNLKDVTKSFLNLLESSIKSNDINIISDINSDINIYGYHNELTQCLINILNNAKDVLCEKVKENRLVFIKTTQINNKAIITIKDNGKGVPDDIIKKIFEPYFTTKHQSQGTGLGLHMAYNLIDSMGGTIEVSNVEYQYENKNYIGAEFKITLPLDERGTNSINSI